MIENKEKSDKNWLIAALLAFCFGGIGLHRFYLGRTKSAWRMFLMGITVVLIPITIFVSWIDLFYILAGRAIDGTGKRI